MLMFLSIHAEKFNFEGTLTSESFSNQMRVSYSNLNHLIQITSVNRSINSDKYTLNSLALQNKNKSTISPQDIFKEGTPHLRENNYGNMSKEQARFSLTN